MRGGEEVGVGRRRDSDDGGEVHFSFFWRSEARLRERFCFDVLLIGFFF